MSNQSELAQLASVFAGSALSNRNLIINGAMQVAQRGTSFSSITADQYVVDRFVLLLNSIGTYTLSQSSVAPDGFSSSFKIDCTTANASPAAGAYSLLVQSIEAQNLQQLAYGTSSAKDMTLSFWVRSSKTGSFGVVVRQRDNSNKMVSKQVTISAVDTWEYKTMYIPSDTSGVINNDNGVGLEISWWINGGSNFSGGSEMTTWGTEDNTAKYLGNLAIGALTTDEFYITGVQLEVGDTATPFEHRSYGQELALCQRYFCKSFPIDTAPASGLSGIEGVSAAYSGNQVYADRVLFPVTMRTTPSITRYPVSLSAGTDWAIYISGAWGTVTDSNATIVKDNGFTPYLSKTGLTTAGAYLVSVNWAADAEL